MSISVLAALVTILGLAPVWTHELFNNSFLRQKTTIALDNAAIILGRQDRTTLNFLVKANRTVSLMEVIHHPIHLAVVMGIATPNLIAQDVSLERAISEIHKGAKTIANVNWARASLMANSELRRFGISVVQKQRAERAPLIEKNCPVCHLGSHWEIDHAIKDTFLRVGNRSWIPAIWIKLVGESLVNGKKWNYKLSLN